MKQAYVEQNARANALLIDLIYFYEVPSARKRLEQLRRQKVI